MRERIRLSVRARTTIGATVVVAVATVAVGLGLVSYLDSKLTQELDAALDSRLQTASRAVQGGKALPAGVTVDITGSERRVQVRPAIAVERGEPYRMAETTVDTPKGTTTLVASASTESVSRATSAATKALLIGAPALLAVVAALTWFSTGRALRPVDAIRSEFARLSAHDLRGRMPVPGGDDAPARLAVTLNETLDRLDESVRRQRQFVADASHELRSPLAAVRTPLEVAQVHPERADWPKLAAGTLEDLDRLDRLVSDLLTLARIDADTVDEAAPLDLSALVGQVVERRALPRVELTADVAGSVFVRGHRGHLGRLLTNLLDNAERHATTRVEVRLSTSDGKAMLEVRDDGPGVPEEYRECIFERFGRVDTARGRGQGGAGLGLALARDIATLHRGSLQLADSGSAGGARFVVVLPAELGSSGPARDT